MNNSDKANVREVLASVTGPSNAQTDRNIKLVEFRFGLYDGKTRTYQETGAHFKITRERAKQIERSILRRLRHPSKARHLPPCPEDHVRDWSPEAHLLRAIFGKPPP